MIDEVYPHERQDVDASPRLVQGHRGFGKTLVHDLLGSIVRRLQDNNTTAIREVVLHHAEGIVLVLDVPGIPVRNNILVGSAFPRDWTAVGDVDDNEVHIIRPVLAANLVVGPFGDLQSSSQIE